MKKLTSLPKTGNLPSGIVESQNAAANRFGVTAKTIRAWRAEGAGGFHANGSIDVGELGAWLKKRRATRGGDDLKSKKTAEEIRKLKLANDTKEGRLIERAWMAERIQVAAGDINTYRAKSEAEHPTRFAAAAGDVARCREIVCGIWDEIMKIHCEMAKHFAEKK